MATSAKDRLKSLFANQPLPPKPEPGVPTLFEVENERFKLQQNRETPTQGTNQSLETNSTATVQSGVPKNVSLSSDEDDDFVATCSSKSKKKPAPPRRRYKPEAGALGYDKGDYIESLAPIQFLPDGKGFVPEDDPKHGLRLADMEDLHEKIAMKHIAGQFVLMSSVAKFPYKYIDDPNDRVSKHFFAGGKLYTRTWKLFYLHLPEQLGSNTFVLVPLEQVQQLINEISTAFRIDISIPAFPFTIPFYNDGTPQPVFLGVSRSRDEMIELQNAIPARAFDHGECPAGASFELKLNFQNWVGRLESSQAASKRSKNAQKRKKNEKRGLTIQEQCDKMKRAQRYLGLRPRMNPILNLDGMTWNQQQEAMSNQKPGLIIKLLNEMKTAPYDFYNQPIIISFDVEAYERDHSVITEIGVSTLDTLDLVETVPGLGGQNWINHIRSRHFLIKGREHLVNRDFVAGCPQSYQFGDSEEVEIKAAADLVDSCFKWPYSVQYKHIGKLRMNRNNESNSISDALPEQIQKGPKQRNIVLLGHDTNTDIEYLKKLGSKIFGPTDPDGTSTDTGKTIQSSRCCLAFLKLINIDRNKILVSILEALDTAALFQVMKRDTQTKSLASLCADLEIAAWYLHNAGNDARYTLEAFVKMMVKARKLEDEAARKAGSATTPCVDEKWEAEKQRRISERMEQARCEALEELEHWEKAKAPGTVAPKRPSSSFPITALSSAMEDLTLKQSETIAANDLTKKDAASSLLNESQQPQTEEQQNEVFTDTTGSDGGSPKIPFLNVIEASNKAKAGKKSSSEKKREAEMEVRIDGGQGGTELGPVEWAPDGKMGCAK